MFAGMIGLNGFATPRYFGEAVRSITIIKGLSELGWETYDPARVLFLILGLLLLVVWLAPNTQQIMARYNRALDPYPDPTSRTVAAPFLWRPMPIWAIAAALGFFVSLVGLLTDKPSEFLYFQF